MSVVERSGVMEIIGRCSPSPPPSENGDDGGFAGSSGCSETTTPIQINNTSTPTPNTTPAACPPSPPSSIRERRNRSSLQREANRSKQFTTRLQRSASTAENTSENDLLGRRRGRGFRRQTTTSLPVDHGLKAIEPPHEQALTKMAFAEQQKWITVQQKTFTKWYASSLHLWRA